MAVEPISAKNSGNLPDSKMSAAPESVEPDQLRRSEQSQNKGGQVTRQISINSPVEQVWKTVLIERDCAPNLVYNTLKQAEDNHSIFEQKWTIVPLLASTTCLIDERQTPMERIDFKLLKSDALKSLEGAWIFAPTDDGKGTLLTLTAHIELRKHGPKPFMHAVASHKMNKRLAHIKELAEEQQTNLKVNGTIL